MLDTRRRSPGVASATLAEYCEQLRFRRLHYARFIAEREARLEAEKATHLKSQFIAMMSHELRTPLNSIIGFSEILMNQRRAAGAATDADYAGLINSSGRHLISVVNSILEMSKIQSGTYVLDLKAHDLVSILRDSVEKLSILSKEKGVILATRIEQPEAMALVDETRARQSIDNILSNAIKFTEPGGFVTASCRAADGEVIVSIVDTGIGMGPDDLARALTPFGQASGGLDRDVEGIGLGLCIAKSLTELQGGRLDIRSEPGVGTEVDLAFSSAATARATAGGEISRWN